jgi:hypothetical protein
VEERENVDCEITEGWNEVRDRLEVVEEETYLVLACDSVPELS